MLMLDTDRLASHACYLRCLSDGAKSFLRMLLHACFVLGRRVLEHLCVGRKYMERQQDRQRDDFGADAPGQGNAVVDGLPGEVRPVRWYQDVGVPSSPRSRPCCAS